MNKIFVISGPSGSGKTTLIKMLINTCEGIKFSVSHTTRKKRDNEVNSKDYYFISHKQFDKMKREKMFAEWAEVHGEFYGTSLEEIRKKSSGSDVLLLDVDVQGASMIRKYFPDSVSVFIMPPDINTLRERLLKREKAIDKNFNQRLITAEKEIAEAKLYDFIIVNDGLNDSFEKLKTLFEQYKEKISSENRSKGE